MRINFFFLLLSPIFCFSQIEFKEVVPVDSTTSAILYNRAKSFIANSFKKYKDVTQLADDEMKTIFVTGSLPIAVDKKNYGHVSFKMNIECKDNKYRYILTDFQHLYINPGGYDLSGGDLNQEKPLKQLNPEIFTQVKKITKEDISIFIATLKSSMSGVSLKEDW